MSGYQLVILSIHSTFIPFENTVPALLVILSSRPILNELRPIVITMSQCCRIFVLHACMPHVFFLAAATFKHQSFSSLCFLSLSFFVLLCLRLRSMSPQAGACPEQSLFAYPIGHTQAMTCIGDIITLFKGRWADVGLEEAWLCGDRGRDRSRLDPLDSLPGRSSSSYFLTGLRLVQPRAPGRAPSGG